MTNLEATKKLLEIAGQSETTAEQVKELIEAGANPNLKDNGGKTAMEVTNIMFILFDQEYNTKLYAKEQKIS